jgi:peptide-methionine (R)-S-oxide reductase
MFAKTGKADSTPTIVGRRSFLFGAGATAIGLSWWYVWRQAQVTAEAASAGLPKTVVIIEFSDSGERKAKVSVERIVKTEDEWKKQLSPISFEVTRHAGTERAFTN